MTLNGGVDGVARYLIFTSGRHGGDLDMKNLHVEADRRCEYDRWIRVYDNIMVYRIYPDAQEAPHRLFRQLWL